MRWLSRSLMLCLFVVVLTPAPAHAWFEWLDRLSGPGDWWGLKVDIRAVCFGAEIPTVAANYQSLDQMTMNLRQGDAMAVAELQRNIAQMRKVDQSLRVLPPGTLDEIERKFNTFFSIRTKPQNPEIEKSQAELLTQAIRIYRDAEVSLREAARFSAAPGIFISLCPSNRLRSFALEFGLTGLRTGGVPTYANNEAIGLATFTAGLSYRIPLSVNSDIIDIGTNVGRAVFFAEGLRPVKRWTIEPFVDLHLPTRLRLQGSKWERLFARFSVRGGLVFFPRGFKPEDFEALPGTPAISGKEANPSVTVFFRVTH